MQNGGGAGSSGGVEDPAGFANNAALSRISEVRRSWGGKRRTHIYREREDKNHEKQPLCDTNVCCCCCCLFRLSLMYPLFVWGLWTCIHVALYTMLRADSLYCMFVYVASIYIYIHGDATGSHAWRQEAHGHRRWPQAKEGVGSCAGACETSGDDGIHGACETLFTLCLVKISPRPPLVSSAFFFSLLR